jgi:hypothetical protein
MTTVETGAPRKKGRPARYGQGRSSLHVRFTPERIALLKALADHNGRSLSEQVEFVVEDHVRAEKLVTKLTAETQGLLAQIYDHQEQIRRHQQQILKLKDENQKLKATARDDGLAARVTALEQAIKGRKS